MTRNPLSPHVFLVRNASKTLPLVGVIVLAVLLISGIVSIMDSIPLSIKTTYGYSKVYCGVTPRGNNAMTPEIRKTIETESPFKLAPIMVCRASEAEVKSIVGPWRFVVIALNQSDMHRYVERLGGGKVEGRFPEPGAAEAIVSEPIARNLGKKLGDILLSPDDSSNFSPHPVKIVGLIHMKPWLILAPIEYHRKNHYPPIDLLIVMSQDVSQQDQLDHWLFEKFKGQQARVFAFYKLEEETDSMFKIIYSILNVVIGLLVVVITLMMAMLMNIYQGQRLQEYGLLQSLGYTRGVLLKRTLFETLIVVIVGWVLGMVIAYGILNIVKSVLMNPRAFMLDPLDPKAYIYSLPVPIAIFLAGTLTVFIKLKSFDPVSIVERRLT